VCVCVRVRSASLSSHLAVFRRESTLNKYDNIIIVRSINADCVFRRYHFKAPKRAEINNHPATHPPSTHTLHTHPTHCRGCIPSFIIHTHRHSANRMHRQVHRVRLRVHDNNNIITYRISYSEIQTICTDNMLPERR